MHSKICHLTRFFFPLFRIPYSHVLGGHILHIFHTSEMILYRKILYICQQSRKYIWFHVLFYCHLAMCFSSVQFSSVAQSCQTFCDPMNRSMSGLPVHPQLPEFTQIHVHWVGDAIQSSHPLSSLSPSSLNLSQHEGLFKWVNSLHQVVKVLEFQLQHSSSNEHPGLISFRMDWLDLFAVQGTLSSLLQHNSSKASILWR